MLMARVDHLAPARGWLADLLEQRRQRATANRAARVRWAAEPTARGSARPPVSELDMRIDGLLSAWHAWRSGYRLGRGYKGSDSTCQDYRAPTHWDWKNGAAQDRAEDQMMRGVDRSIERIPNDPQRWRTAIEVEARNLHCDAAVWSSPALPSDRTELEILRMEARNHLLRELQREGVLT
jgi:hypothetical protein